MPTAQGVSLLYRRLGRKPPKPGIVRRPPPRVRLFEREYAQRLGSILKAWGDRIETIARAGTREDAKAKTPRDSFRIMIRRPDGGWFAGSTSHTRESAEKLAGTIRKGSAKFGPGRETIVITKAEFQAGQRAGAYGMSRAEREHFEKTGRLFGEEAQPPARPRPPRVPAPKVTARTALGEELSAAFNMLVEASGLESWLGRVAGKIADGQAGYTKQVLKLPPVGIARQSVIEDFRRRNVSLVTNMGAEQAEQIADILRPAQATGRRWEEIAPEIQDRLGVSESRARLIARDQTNKFNGDMQRTHQEAAGIKEYVWSTSKDFAVRGRPGGENTRPGGEDHWALEGKRFRWDSPPLIPGTNERAHPGQRINCRCVAIPVVPFFE